MLYTGIVGTKKIITKVKSVSLEVQVEWSVKK